MACNYSFGLIKYISLGLLLHCTIPCNAAAPLESSSGFDAPENPIVSDDEDSDNKKAITIDSAPRELLRSSSGLGAALAASPSPSPAGSAGMSPAPYRPFRRQVLQECIKAIQCNNPDILKAHIPKILQREISDLEREHRDLVTQLARQAVHPSSSEHEKALLILSHILERQKQLEPQQQRQQ